MENIKLRNYLVNEGKSVVQHARTYLNSDLERTRALDFCMMQGASTPSQEEADFLDLFEAVYSDEQNPRYAASYVRDIAVAVVETHSDLLSEEIESVSAYFRDVFAELLSSELRNMA